IMEFSIGKRSFGINVAKVLEIMQYQEVTPIPHANPYIEGVFKPRDSIITVVNLPAYLNLEDEESRDHKDIMIITNFNNTNTAFHVHNVEMIHRISWTAMEKPDETIYKDENNLTVGIARLGEKLITILDFEKIMADMSPNSAISPSDFEATDKVNNSPIFVAEDSLFLINILEECLHNAGYMNVHKFSNGKDCLDALMDIKASGVDITSKVKLLITDIEMPMMDGHALTKTVKEDPVLKQLPVIIFSSLINEAMMEKGYSVGANEQITKPEIHRLVGILEKYI
ncbi:chemotaxis protein, partial [Tyzzerella sp. OttesenSCG-928-J15]|nr:chemotaxis protein [Tyzzerella sp. OttesenSCG-928-J15]